MTTPRPYVESRQLPKTWVELLKSLPHASFSRQWCEENFTGELYEALLTNKVTFNIVHQLERIAQELKCDGSPYLTELREDVINNRFESYQ